jgi:prepilin-type N-terminal cleavage/methylation domain-containing protein/prepilin-type processing-associated H-X9-DG protein
MCHIVCRSCLFSTVARNCRARRRATRSGFTLVELLVVMTIIGILMSLLLPAVNSARAAARMAACMNNLHQIGLATQTHAQQIGWFPSGGWGTGWIGDPTQGAGSNQPGGFFYNLLPFIEQQNLWAYGQAQVNGQATYSWQAAAMPVSVYNCTSRRPLGALPYSASFINMNPLPPTPMLARCDYAACGGDADLGAGPRNFTPPTSVSASQTPGAWSQITSAKFNGVCVPHSQLQSGAITRGTSCTLLVGEKYLNPDNYMTGVDPGDNASWDYGYDTNVVRWSGGGNPTSGTSAGPGYLPAQDTPGMSNYNAFGSTHVAGFNMAFCDGSARTLNYTIDPTMWGYIGDRLLTTDTTDVMDDNKW